MKKLIVPYILIAYIAGIIIASLIKLPQVYLLGLFLLFIVLLLRQNSVKNKIFPIILIFTFFFAGYHLMYLKINFNSALLNQVNNNLILQGMVVETITYDNRVVYKLKNPIILLPDRKIYGRNEAVQLIVYDTSDTYSYGEIIEANGILEIPNSKRNPGEFDYKSYLRIRNIFTCMYVSPKDIVKVGEVIGNPFLNCASQIKNRLVNIIESLPITEKNTALGILLGDKSGFAPEDKGHFQNLGIMHIFAVSGLHVGFLIFILITLTNLLRFPALIGKTNTNIIISICLLLYCAVTGFSTPVIRSSIMLGIYLFSRNPWNNNLTANALFLSAMIILIINPLYLFDAGFQLTFSATAFIIFLSPILQKNKYFKIKNEMIAISLSAWLGTLPLTIYYFNYFAPLGVIAAIPAGLMAGIVIILGFIALVTDLVIESLTEIFVIAIGGTIYYSRVVLLLLSKLPFIGDGIITATPKVSSILTYYALFIFIFISFFHRFNPSFKLFIHKKSKVLKYLIIITVLLIILFNILTPHQLEVVFLDVGQGDAIFICTPTGHTILIDGGDTVGDYNMGELVIIPFLKHRGIKKIDMVINTHPDSDHLSGLKPVLEQYPIGLFLLPAGFDEEYKSLMKIIQDQKIHFLYGSKGQSFQLENKLFLNILHPPADYPVSLGTNNNSLVVELNFENISFLFTGDIESEAINHLIPIASQTNVLKFPHHGSQYSFDAKYLAKVNPQIVVIQVGKNNSFGHPSENVLNYFEENRVPVYRNDLHGAINIYSKGKVIDKVETVIK